MMSGDYEHGSYWVDEPSEFKDSANQEVSAHKNQEYVELNLFAGLRFGLLLSIFQ
jgi:hypothetical protein